MSVQEYSAARDMVNSRDQRYGYFGPRAELTQHVQMALLAHLDANNQFLRLDNRTRAQIRQAMSMIVDKLARAAVGNPVYPDNPLDIEGYAAMWGTAIADAGAMEAQEKAAYAHDAAAPRGAMQGLGSASGYQARRSADTSCAFCGAQEGNIHKPGCIVLLQQGVNERG